MGFLIRKYQHTDCLPISKFLNESCFVMYQGNLNHNTNNVAVHSEFTSIASKLMNFAFRAQEQLNSDVGENREICISAY